jgi:hypothetical protein
MSGNLDRALSNVVEMQQTVTANESAIVVNPTAIDNVTVTATTVQTAFEQQETKTIYGGSF